MTNDEHAYHVKIRFYNYKSVIFTWDQMIFYTNFMKTRMQVNAWRYLFGQHIFFSSEVADNNKWLHPTQYEIVI